MRAYVIRRFLKRVVLGSLLLTAVYLVWNWYTGRQHHIEFLPNAADFYYSRDRQVDPPHEMARIPMILHQTWVTKNVRREFVKWIKKWKEFHPDLEHWFWTDETARLFIEKKYPEYLDLYDSYPRNIQRVDVFRYFVMFEFGGIYADLDVELVKSLDPVLNIAPCILAAEPYEHSHVLHPDFISKLGATISNAFMACRPKHPFFKLVMDRLHPNRGFWPSEKSNVIRTTGPGLMGKVLGEYVIYTGCLKTSHPESILIFRPEYFMPVPDPIAQAPVMDLCKTGICDYPHCYYRKYLQPFGKSVCEELLQGKRTFYRDPKLLSEALTIHHFVRSWTGMEGGLEIEKWGEPIHLYVRVVWPETRL
jgi:hypothetical protein